MHPPVRDNEFYGAYDRRGQGCILKGKHIRQFNKDFVEASEFGFGMSVLELGCGNGLFLRFLTHLGVENFAGIDGDPRVLDEVPAKLAERVTIAEFDDYFERHPAGAQYDRVVMFDVFEHFAPEDGAALLRRIAPRLAPGGRIVIRVPNMGSPWGLNVQYNDVTHRACYTPGSISQTAKVAGYKVVAVRPQAYTSAWREIRERLLTGFISWFLVAPPRIWSPNFISVLERNPD